MARVQTTAEIIANAPRCFLEGIAFGGMIVLVLVLLIQRGADLSAMMPTLGVIAAAGLRLIPALQTIHAQFMSLRSGRPTLESVHRDMVGLDQENAIAQSRRDAIPPKPLKRRLELSGIRYAIRGPTAPPCGGST